MRLEYKSSYCKVNILRVEMEMMELTCDIISVFSSNDKSKQSFPTEMYSIV